jgi:predicted regulator of Ras-like GTPase activity (Roadblock/LC7/MglB family)
MVGQTVMYDEEFRLITQVCEKLCRDANSRAVFVIDKNGTVMSSTGDTERLDSTSLASLVAGEIAATGGMAKLIGESEFNTLFHEGERDNLHISVVSGRVILVVIFDNRSSLGLVRLRVKKASEGLARILEEAVNRTEAEGAPTPFGEITDDDIDNLFSM